MRQIKIITDEGLDTATIQQISELEVKLDIALAGAKFVRTATSKSGDSIEFTYTKRINGDH